MVMVLLFAVVSELSFC